MKNMIIIAGLLISGQVFAQVNPAVLADVLADASVQMMLSEYQSGKDSILSLKITSPSAQITMFEIVSGIPGDTMRECRSVKTVESRESRVVEIEKAMDCE